MGIKGLYALLKTVSNNCDSVMSDDNDNTDLLLDRRSIESSKTHFMTVYKNLNSLYYTFTRTFNRTSNMQDKYIICSIDTSYLWRIKSISKDNFAKIFLQRVLGF